MKPLDRILQRWRIKMAGPYIPPGSRVLDIGCGDGALFRVLQEKIGEGIGIEPTLTGVQQQGRMRLLAGVFPDKRLEAEPPFDAITMLAVLEHIPETELAETSASCAKLLKPGGKLILTVPSPRVDQMLHWLMRCGLVDGMAAHEHHGFDARQTPALFQRAGLRPIVTRRFQLGLNNLFVLEKPSLME